MVNVALLVRLEAKPGKEADVEQFLRDGLSIVEGEPDTVAWFAVRFGPSAPSVSSTRSPTTAGDSRTSASALARPRCNEQRNYSTSRQPSRTRRSRRPQSAP
jgi:hypothetical protein